MNPSLSQLLKFSMLQVKLVGSVVVVDMAMRRAIELLSRVLLNMACVVVDCCSQTTVTPLALRHDVVLSATGAIR